MIVLGIESSCDETAVSIIKNEKVLSHVLFSQATIHSEFGGVIPEIAARSHLEVIDKILEQAIDESSIKFEDIDVFAATCGPGLAGGLIVGSLASKTLSLIFNKPFIAINHLQGHALLPTMDNNIQFPFLLLLVSGGHTQFVAVSGVNSYKILGTTIDDSIGEAFDKTSRMLGLGYPGGSKIEELAKKGNASRYQFPLPLYNQKNCNFSFSGLKTAIRQTIIKSELNDITKADIAASVQKGISKILTHKSKRAIEVFQKEYGELNAFVLSGGVAANMTIRADLQSFLDKKNIRLFCPPLHLCTDNGIMVSWAALQRARLGLFDNLNFPIKVRWSLESL